MLSQLAELVALAFPGQLAAEIEAVLEHVDLLFALCSQLPPANKLPGPICVEDYLSGATLLSFLRIRVAPASVFRESAADSIRQRSAAQIL